MRNTISYEQAVFIMAQTYKGDLFDASILLCNLFQTEDKEKTLQDIVNERQRIKPQK